MTRQNEIPWSLICFAISAVAFLIAYMNFKGQPGRELMPPKVVDVIARIWIATLVGAVVFWLLGI
jgi:hypothetical protein